ncbi:MAG: hypothetical protein OQK32_02965 [Gammaproteobacteria bacterium]|nr:hypothetical protein [Gammaproteobacteria bacterium]MCW8923619.1 hypothetical protein [Gammaproteobacteria bacterium]
MSTKQDESSEIQSLLYDLEGELYVLIKREHAEISDELSQMGSVVSDAIKTLMQSLNSLSGQLKEQNDLMQKIVSAVDDVESEKQQQAYHAVSKMVNQNITAVVRSFQFEDIVQQLVNHCSTRSANLEQLFDRVNQNVEELKKAGQVESERVLSMMKTDIAKVSEDLKKENPVKQTSMGAGEIELF